LWSAESGRALLALHLRACLEPNDWRFDGFRSPEGWRAAQLGLLQVAASRQFFGDVGRDVARPALDGVEADNAHRIAVLAAEQALKYVLKLGRLGIRLTPDLAKFAEVRR
jgi:hypothetical protein